MSGIHVHADYLPLPVDEETSGIHLDATGPIEVWANFSSGAYDVYATGVVAVNPRLIFTAGHVAYNAARDVQFLPPAGGVRGATSVVWGGRDGGSVSLRGSRLLTSYADLAKKHGVESEEAFARDLAVMFAYEPLWRGSLPTVSTDGAALLGSALPKTITGFPRGLYPLEEHNNDENRNRLHLTGPFSGPLSRIMGAYHGIAGVSMGPGGSGGGVWVEAEGGFTLAGIYVSGLSTLRGADINLAGVVALDADHLSLAQESIHVAELYSTPHIITLPQSPVMDAAGFATLEVVASGDEPLSFQWYARRIGEFHTEELKDGETFAGTNSPVLQIDDPRAYYAAYEFRLGISNTVGFKSTPWISIEYADLTSPALTFSQRHWIMSAKENPIIRFTVTGRPFPEIEWGYGGGVWEPLDESHIVTTGVDSVEIRVDGLPFEKRPLQARVSNMFGTTYSPAITLEYVDLTPPKLKDDRPREVLVVPGPEQVITFGLDGAPYPAIRWEYRIDEADPWRGLSHMFAWGSSEWPELHFEWRNYGGKAQFRMIGESILGSVESAPVSATVAMKPTVTITNPTLSFDLETVGNPDWEIAGDPVPHLDHWLYSWDGDEWRQVPERFGQNLADILEWFSPYQNSVRLRAVFANAAGKVISNTIYPSKTLIPEGLRLADGSVFHENAYGWMSADGNRLVVNVRTSKNTYDWHTLVYDSVNRRWSVDSVTPDQASTNAPQMSGEWMVFHRFERIGDGWPEANIGKLQFYRQGEDHRWKLAQEMEAPFETDSHRLADLQINGRYASLQVPEGIALFHLRPDGVWYLSQVIPMNEILPGESIHASASAIFDGRLHVMVSSSELAVFRLREGAAELERRIWLPIPSGTWSSGQEMAVGADWIHVYAPSRLYEKPEAEAEMAISHSAIIQEGRRIGHSSEFILTGNYHPRLIQVSGKRPFNIVGQLELPGTDSPSIESATFGQSFFVFDIPDREEGEPHLLYVDLQEVLTDNAPSRLAPLRLQFERVADTDEFMTLRFWRQRGATEPSVWWSGDGLQWQRLPESNLQLDSRDPDRTGVDEWLARVNRTTAGSSIFLQLRE